MTEQQHAVMSFDSCTGDRSGSAAPGLNLFRRSNERDIICAVPEDFPVPSFLQDPAWFFAGKLDGEAPRVSGFDSRAARSACANLGFYLFLTWNGTVRTREA